MNYVYTLIIPHYNIPKLLNRCLKSLPKRDDLQVIIVDDHSDCLSIKELKNIEEKYNDFTFVYLSVGGGGGKARNEGLKLAKGTYVFFADADDYFNFCIDDILDKYKYSNYDVIYFDANSVDTDVYSTAFRCRHLNRMIHLYEKEPERSIFNLKYYFGEPWCKMVKREIIENNNIRFSETKIHNDTKFSYLVGYYSSNVIVDNHALYCVTDRVGSVSKNLSLESYFIRSYVFSEAAMFFYQHGINVFVEFTYSPLSYFVLKGDWLNCRRCIGVMKSFGMSNNMIIYGCLKYMFIRIKMLPLSLFKRVVRKFLIIDI